MRLIDREDLYRSLYAHTDHFGILQFSVKDGSKKFGIEEKSFYRMLLEYVDTNRMKKVGRGPAAKYQLKNPDSFEWGEEWEVEVKKARIDRYPPSRRETVFGKRDRAEKVVD